jgi:hypothetical protein
MSTTNRKRRAAKARRRTAERLHARRPDPHTTPPLDSDPTATPAFLTLTNAVLDAGQGNLASIELLARHSVEDQQRAFDTPLSTWVKGLIAKGWTPLDIAEMVRRHASGPMVTSGERSGRRADRAA